MYKTVGAPIMGTKEPQATSIMIDHIVGREFPTNILAAGLRAEATTEKEKPSPQQSAYKVIDQMVRISDEVRGIGALRRDREIADILTCLCILDNSGGERIQDLRRGFFTELVQLTHTPERMRTLDLYIAQQYLKLGREHGQGLRVFLHEQYSNKALLPEFTAYGNVELCPGNEQLQQFVTTKIDELAEASIASGQPNIETIHIFSLDPAIDHDKELGVIERSKDYRNMIFCLEFGIVEFAKKNISASDLQGILTDVLEAAKATPLEITPSIDGIVFSMVVRQIKSQISSLEQDGAIKHMEILESVSKAYSNENNCYAATRQRNPLNGSMLDPFVFFKGYNESWHKS